ncbi:2OG-Fe(II) oxygenase [Metapseudomonas boanensis]|uniref:2OG-Fe(II) oxygenase n=1 Tax=Metapseudomonas boanensis TaxID=2822138 RepID=A0ABS5XPR5_9GAMM|nr:2OG-Fe(II) oxygenase [Pseudomonas boanensis]MBT8769101.1 2OG-Fe(II) oxygenase [Pseudomonas boanensis]
MRKYPVAPGEAVPWFTSSTPGREHFTFDTIAGRYIALCFLGSAADPTATRVLADLLTRREIFDDSNACFFGVTADPRDREQNRVRNLLPGIRFFWDFDRSIFSLYGALQESGAIRQMTYLLDPRLRVIAVLPIVESGKGHVDALLALLQAQPPIAPATAVSGHAPVLVVPRIFEPDLCQALIDYYEEHGGTDSGFMVERDGKTVELLQYDHKRRRDRTVEDEALRKRCIAHITRRLLPEVEKAFQFQATRMERYLVSCYDAEEGGHFRPHRDNTTKGTAHRRFAVSLFLNSGDYDGGSLRFPEFGQGTYSAPRGGAVVFSCSLLHEATPVTAGRRYMFLPFLYDEAGRRIREQNLPYLAEAGEVAER